MRFLWCLWIKKVIGKVSHNYLALLESGVMNVQKNIRVCQIDTYMLSEREV